MQPTPTSLPGPRRCVLRAFYANWLWKFYGNVPYYEP